ncbi:MAG: 30S ribosomal protein S8 [Deltaproteobacteria bacterium]|nr:30S ribosomal protein S8 [Deltaproteobacteria bacterium]NND29370.1 30S ribosomal protein S8 [Myxococcales bacterium]MBT8466584.1 30S ribosomal protein S8 [Deltaproteobacteria bacterium]MBT8481064.1 30S ribosomal protein S8 [Deltaproteobacteria bacterium]NNK06797.1 30S ribosomal protein S8 [Myxococcales bacterium]
MMTDPIADMLTRIRNAAQAQHEHTVLPSSNLKAQLAEILKQEGYIDDYRVEDGVQKSLTIFLKYGRDRQSAFVGMRRASRPGRRFYVGHHDIPRVQNGMGVAILSTSAGIMTGRDARHKRVGGEVLCEVW